MVGEVVSSSFSGRIATVTRAPGARSRGSTVRSLGAAVEPHQAVRAASAATTAPEKKLLVPMKSATNGSAGCS